MKSMLAALVVLALPLTALAMGQKAEKGPPAAAKDANADAKPANADAKPAAGDAAAPATATVGQPAPAFSLPGTDGKTHQLSDYAGKVVVLEWTNPDCPFVKKHYGAGNMQKIQADLTGKDVVWLTVSTNAAGKQGHLTAEAGKAFLEGQKAAATTLLLDHDGKTGRAYGAKTTPHMYVIDPKGVLVYAGAIDDKPTAKPADIEGAKNYVVAAVEETLAGKPVTTASTQPYGCSVKY